jgi:hypothetical protein
VESAGRTGLDGERVDAQWHGEVGKVCRGAVTADLHRPTRDEGVRMGAALPLRGLMPCQQACMMIVHHLRPCAWAGWREGVLGRESYSCDLPVRDHWRRPGDHGPSLGQQAVLGLGWGLYACSDSPLSRHKDVHAGSTNIGRRPQALVALLNFVACPVPSVDYPLY